jgi:hypothetical protein
MGVDVLDPPTKILPHQGGGGYFFCLIGFLSNPATAFSHSFVIPAEAGIQACPANTWNFEVLDTYLPAGRQQPHFRRDWKVSAIPLDAKEAGVEINYHFFPNFFLFFPRFLEQIYRTI